MGFLCSQCGACCIIAGKSGFMPSREDGACIHLLEDNSCGIYDTRPDICKVDKMFEIKSKEDPELTLKKHYKLNTKACHDLIDILDIDKKYKIKLEDYDK